MHAWTHGHGASFYSHRFRIVNQGAPGCTKICFLCSLLAVRHTRVCADCAQFTSKILAPLFVTGVSSVFSLRYIGWGNAQRKKKGAVVYAP